MNTRFSSEYNNILHLMDLILTFPATSTVCEQEVSHMKLIKTDNRTKLSEEVLSNSILIKLHSPPIGEFDPTAAVKYQMELKPRRPGCSTPIENKKRGLYSLLCVYT